MRLEHLVLFREPVDSCLRIGFHHERVFVLERADQPTVPVVSDQDCGITRIADANGKGWQGSVPRVMTWHPLIDRPSATASTTTRLVNPRIPLSHDRTV